MVKNESFYKACGVKYSHDFTSFVKRILSTLTRHCIVLNQENAL